MCKQVRIMEDKLWGGFVKVAEPWRPTQTVKAEEASWRRQYLRFLRRPWGEFS